MIEGSRLGQFFKEAGTKKFTRRHDIMLALRERWWDSTHTFHFPWGEMTMTPTDFAFITGLPSEGEPLTVDPFYFRKKTEIKAFLGTDFKPTSDDIRLDRLNKYLLLNAQKVKTEGQIQCLMRVFLLWALGSTLLCNASTMARFSWLPFVVDLENLDRYDWGGAGLATCYWGMDHVCRDATTSLTGFIHAWEVFGS